MTTAPRVNRSAALMCSRQPRRGARAFTAPAIGPRPAGSCGFSLVEVLVSLVILSVGLLGIAGLYVESLRAERTSLYRLTAVTLAADMADRIRANAVAGVAYAGSGPGVDNNCVNGIAGCAPGQLAADDWFSWYQDVLGRLPGDPTASIAVASVPPLTQYTIRLNWPEPGQAEPAEYVLVTQELAP